MKGRPRKPTQLKVIEGNRGKRRIAPDAPVTPGVPRCPAHLKGAARRMWKLVAGELDALGLIAKVDGAALEGVCVAYCRAIEADRALAEFGLTYSRGLPSGDLVHVKRPEIAISRDSWAQVKSFCVEFGLTPVSRSRLSVGKTKEIDRLEEVLAG